MRTKKQVMTPEAYDAALEEFDRFVGSIVDLYIAARRRQDDVRARLLLDYYRDIREQEREWLFANPAPSA